METAAPYTSRTASPISGVVAKPATRLLFIDNLRIYLTILVILHHLMVIYTGSGGWIYYEGRQDEITNAFGSWFCAVNQGYFMGLFLLISAYFVPGAYDRKGPGRFLLDRLLRLGLPLAFYSWVLRPLFIYLWMRPTYQPFWGWYRLEYFRVYSLIGGGPLWFIEALLLFSLLYVIGRVLFSGQAGQPASALPPEPRREATRFPSSWAIALFGLLLGIASFLVRLVFLVNDTFVPLNFQFANFAQYGALFVTGLVLYRRNWLVALPDRTGKFWLGIAITLVLLYPPLALLAGAAENEQVFLGGWHWQAILAAIWEAFVCLGACIGLIYLFLRRFNRQRPLGREMGRSAYTAYLLHEPVITLLAIFTMGVMYHPLIKFILAAVVSIPLCFVLSSLIRRLPLARRIL